MANTKVHPAVDDGVKPGNQGFAGATLVCKCTTDPVEVEVDNAFLFNHLCGCTKCWKPEGAMFSMLAAVPNDKVKVTRHEEKLKVVNPNAVLHRHACTACGAHMYDTVPDPTHVFHGFIFIHPDLSKDAGYAPPTFAAFVSSVIEGGVPPAQMNAVRSRLHELGIKPYDCYSPELMDIVATHAAKQSGALRQ
ncbi:MAG: S-(hydroxymethyl)glutathione synthase [Rhodanobacteraceae bacterium]